MISNLNFPLINQNGLSEWVFLKLASEIAQILNTSQFYTKLTYCLKLINYFFNNVGLDIISGISRNKILKISFKTFFLPLIWILNILYNLFFVSQKNYENETTQNQKSFSLI